MRRLENYVKKYGSEFGPKLFHALQSQAAHAQVAYRLRRKLDVLTGKVPPPVKPEKPLPLFGTDNVEQTLESPVSVANVA
jgi:hypothetical protein